MIAQTFTLEQAADAIGVAPDTLAEWRRDGRLEPTWTVKFETDAEEAKEEAKPDPSAPLGLDEVFRGVLLQELTKVGLPPARAEQVVEALGGGVGTMERNAEQLIAGSKQTYLFVQFCEGHYAIGETHLFSNPDLDIGLFIDYLAARPSERQNPDAEPASTVAVFCVGAALHRALQKLGLTRGDQ